MLGAASSCMSTADHCQSTLASGSHLPYSSSLLLAGPDDAGPLDHPSPVRPACFSFSLHLYLLDPLTPQLRCFLAQTMCSSSPRLYDGAIDLSSIPSTPIDTFSHFHWPDL